MPLMYQWYLLMKEMEEFSIRTGMGLPNTWGLVNEMRFEEAVADFERVKAEDHDYQRKYGKV